jgi:hypothetical protein
MPSYTEWQIAANALHQAFLVNLMAEAEAELYADGSDSDYDTDESLSDTTDSSSESSESSLDDEILPPASQVYLDALAELYSQRYLNSRQPIAKSDTQLHLLLTEWKVSRPEIFRSYLRINPACFDDLVAVIQDDEVFQNNSNNPQMPVAEQLAIALFRFGHYGNATSTLKVALWAGVGYGTVHLVTSRVLKALCSEQFWRSALQWSSDEAKEAAKAWVEDHSCPAWRDGWLMVDGTLVPLFMRPAFFGNTWFDRKSNYSMNVQVSQILSLNFISHLLCGLRLFLHQTSELLTMELVYLEVSMMQ